MTPLSKATKNEPIGSKLENWREVIAFEVLLTFSSLPIENLAVPLVSYLIEPKKAFP